MICFGFPFLDCDYSIIRIVGKVKGKSENISGNAKIFLICPTSLDGRAMGRGSIPRLGNGDAATSLYMAI
jgi:hypothetical protein